MKRSTPPGPASAGSTRAGPKRARLDPEERREQLVRLGAQLFAERRYTEVPVDEIADRAGISRGLLFHYFPTKRDFHVAVVEWLGRQMLERTTPREWHDDPIRLLATVLEAYLDYVEGNRDTYLALVRGGLGGDDRLREIIDRTRTAQAEVALDVLGGIGVEIGPTVRLAVRGWIAFVEEITVTWLRDPAVERADVLALAMRALPATIFSDGALDSLRARVDQHPRT
ncbi:TetR/AcrR family transcriptional regulator [Millisia brevis]|uniref:TetR/AcrR family transcriptional regulator n=1 Tax=Millisia brevis TaxID=264148 RepID=UPI00082F140E|nr:TetR/AcrR family transcriptional regulator [Millisia brevis]